MEWMNLIDVLRIFFLVVGVMLLMAGGFIRIYILKNHKEEKEANGFVITEGFMEVHTDSLIE